MTSEEPIFDDHCALRPNPDDVTHENFVSYVDPYCMEDARKGDNANGFIKIKMPFVVKEIRKRGNPEKCTIRYVKKIEKYLYNISDPDLLMAGTTTEHDLDVIAKIEDKEERKQAIRTLPFYMGKKYGTYLNSDTHYPSATDNMSDSDIVKMAKKFYSEELNANYINEYSIIEKNIMEKCPFDIGRIVNRLNTDCERLVGLNSNYTFYGKRGSSSGIHPENYELPSLNICYSGVKVWIILNYLNSRKLDSEIQKTFENDNQYFFVNCAFKSSHKCIDITPNWLDKRGIKYTYCVQRPGDLLVINTGCSHMVVNVSAAIAIANNIFLPSNIDFEETKMCHCKGNYAKGRISIPNYFAMREVEILRRQVNSYEEKIAKLEERVNKLLLEKEADVLKILEKDENVAKRKKKSRGDGRLCNICGHFCRDNFNFQDHFMRNHDESRKKTWKCEKCVQTFFTENEKKRHLKRKHPQEE